MVAAEVKGLISSSASDPGRLSIACWCFCLIEFARATLHFGSNIAIEGTGFNSLDLESPRNRVFVGVADIIVPLVVWQLNLQDASSLVERRPPWMSLVLRWVTGCEGLTLPSEQLQLLRGAHLSGGCLGLVVQIQERGKPIDSC